MATYSAQELLQTALFKAAKVSNIKLMREFIEAGADPFALDKFGRDVIFYAAKQNPVETYTLFEEIKAGKGSRNA